MKTPDITPAQILAALSAVIGLFCTQGLIDNNTEKLLGGAASILIPMTWKIADAIIRHGRSRALLNQPPAGATFDTTVDNSPTSLATPPAPSA